MTQFSDVVRTLQQWMAERDMVPPDPVVLVLDTPTARHAEVLLMHMDRDLQSASPYLVREVRHSSRRTLTVLGTQVVVAVQGRALP